MARKPLTDAEVMQIQELLKNGISGNQLAKQFQVNKGVISSIKSGERIAHSSGLFKKRTPNKPGTAENSKRFGKKLTEADARIIKKRIKNKELLKDIARDYDVNPQTISNIKKGLTFKNVD